MKFKYKLKIILIIFVLLNFYFVNIVYANNAKTKEQIKQEFLETFYKGSFEVTIKYAKEYVKKYNPSDTEAILIIAQSLLWSGNINEATDWYYKFFKVNPNSNDPLIYYQFAECLKAQNKFDEAIYKLNYAINKLNCNDETKSLIYLSLGYCYLNKNQFELAEKYFKKIKNYKKEQYFEAMGEYYSKLSIFDTPEIYFNIVNKTIEKIYSKENLNKALSYFERSLALNPKNSFLKIKIADIKFMLGDINNAISIMKKAAYETNSFYAYIRLSYFIKENYKTSEIMLNESINYLDQAIKFGGPISECEYEKANIYKLLNNFDNELNALKKSAQFLNGNEWFSFYLMLRLIDLTYDISQENYIYLISLCDKIAKYYKPEAELLYSLVKLKFKNNYVLNHLINFLNLSDNITDDNAYTLYSTALSIFKSLNYEIKLFNLHVFEKLSNKFNEIIKKDIKTKLALIDKEILHTKNKKDLTLLYEAKVELLISLSDFKNAYYVQKYLIMLYELYDRSKKVEALKKAYIYAINCNETNEAYIIALKLFKENQAEKDHLINIIYSNYWNGNKELANNAIEKLKTIDPNNVIIPMFKGINLLEQNKFKSALKEFKKANQILPNDNYIINQIKNLVNNLRTTVSYSYFFSNDSLSLRNQENIVNFEFKSDKSSLNFGYSSKLNEKAYNFISNNFANISNLYLGIDYELNNKEKLNLKLNYEISNENFYNITSKNKILPIIEYYFNNKNTQLMLSYFEKRLLDTPITNILNIYTKNFKLGIYNYLDIFPYSFEFIKSFLSDGNLRTTFVSNLGYLVNKNLKLKYIFSYDNMDHEYNDNNIILNGITFMPYEAYYAPKGIRSNSIGLEYFIYKPKLNISTSIILFGYEKRNEGPASKFNNLTITIDKLLTKDSGFILNVFGLKSEMNPFSDQTTKSIYIGREFYLKYYFKL